MNLAITILFAVTTETTHFFVIRYKIILFLKLKSSEQ